jgi:hypothetical protein
MGWNMPRTLGAKDKKKRKKRLLNIALGVGGVATLGGLGYLALRKKMPTIGSASRPPDLGIQVRNTPVSRSTAPIKTPQITAASSPPPRVNQPDIPAKPKLIPTRAEVQPNSIVPASPKLLPPGKTSPTVTPAPTVKALPPAKPQPQTTKPKPIPTRAEVQPSSITPIQTAIPRQPKLLPPAKVEVKPNPPSGQPKVEVVQSGGQPKSRSKSKPKVVRRKTKTVKPRTKVQDQKSFIKKAAEWSRKNNAAMLERKKNIAKILIRKATGEQGQKVAKAVLKRSPKLAGMAARTGVKIAKSVSLTRRQLLQAAGASAAVQGKQVAGEAIAQANPITKLNKAFKDVKQLGIEADKAADLLEEQGNKVVSRREILRRARQYGIDYIRARPERTVKPIASSAYKNLGYLADPASLARDLAKPENMGLLAKWIERIGGATGLYSDGQELTEFVDEDY